MALVRIRYKGLSDVRVITKQDLEQFGIKTDQDLVWDNVGAARGGRLDAPNARRGLVVDGLSDDLLAALRSEGTFTISEIKDDGTDGDDIIVGEPLDDTGAVHDLTTGQKTGKAVPSGTAAGATTPTGSTGKGSST